MIGADVGGRRLERGAQLGRQRRQPRAQLGGRDGVVLGELDAVEPRGLRAHGVVAAGAHVGDDGRGGRPHLGRRPAPAPRSAATVAATSSFQGSCLMSLLQRGAQAARRARPISSRSSTRAARAATSRALQAATTSRDLERRRARDVRRRAASAARRRRRRARAPAPAPARPATTISGCAPAAAKWRRVVSRIPRGDAQPRGPAGRRRASRRSTSSSRQQRRSSRSATPGRPSSSRSLPTTPTSSAPRSQARSTSPAVPSSQAPRRRRAAAPARRRPRSEATGRPAASSRSRTSAGGAPASQARPILTRPPAPRRSRARRRVRPRGRRRRRRRVGAAARGTQQRRLHAGRRLRQRRDGEAGAAQLRRPRRRLEAADERDRGRRADELHAGLVERVGGPVHGDRRSPTPGMSQSKRAEQAVVAAAGGQRQTDAGRVGLEDEAGVVAEVLHQAEVEGQPRRRSPASSTRSRTRAEALDGGLHDVVARQLARLPEHLLAAAELEDAPERR